MTNKKKEYRDTGYYWVKNRTGAWMIAKWWNNIQFWDTMTMFENDTRPPFPTEIDERRIFRNEPEPQEINIISLPAKKQIRLKRKRPIKITNHVKRERRQRNDKRNKTNKFSKS